MEKVLNTREFAAATRVSLPTAYNILQSGKVRAARTGRDWKVLESEVEKYLRGGVEVSGGAEKAEAIEAA